MTTKSGWCITGHHRACRYPGDCPCQCHKEAADGADSVH